MKILVTGGAGFIGSCFVRMMLGSEPDEILNLDKLTYAGNLDNLSTVANHERYRFEHGDICDAALVGRVFERERPNAVVHFAAESHVDRSILAPQAVFETNLRGTFTLLEAARAHGIGRFVHISTDEVYGSLEAPLEADENYPLRASSPYSAAKAGSDLLALSYFNTYRLPVLVTRASKNDGPYQFPEKLIPLMISNALDGKPLPVYGDGQQIRDWLYVEDHCRGILAVLRGGRDGEIYNIGGNASVTNMEVVRKILEGDWGSGFVDPACHRSAWTRPAVRPIEQQVDAGNGLEAGDGFRTRPRPNGGMYRANTNWVSRVRSGEYQAFYKANYASRSILA